jgi:hypothetical protein
VSYECALRRRLPRVVTIIKDRPVLDDFCGASQAAFSTEDQVPLSEKVEQSLTRHKPTPEQAGRIERIRGAAKAFAEAIETEAKPSRETSLAMTNLEQSLMWATKGVILEPTPPPQ